MTTSRLLDILDNYFNEAYKRTSEASNLGKGHEKYYKALDKKLKVETAEYLKNAALKITGNKPEGWLSKTAGKWRHVQALSDLGLAALYQPGQIANTAAYGGVLRSARVLKDFAGGKYKEQSYKALRSGALSPDVTMELIGRTKQDLPLFKNKKVQNFMYGIGTMDEFMRVHAYSVGEMMLNEARSGNAGAARELKTLGFNDPMKANAEDVGFKLSNKTQYQTSPAYLPQWATTDWGKMLFQYKNFMYRHGMFVKDMFKDAAKGNVRPLARFLGAGAFAGEVIADIRETLKGRPLDPDEKDTPWDDSQWEENLLAATRNRRISWSHPAMRLLQNYSMLGGAGIMQSYLEGAASPTKTLAKVALGPVASNVEDLLTRTSKQGSRGVAQWAEQQIPVYGYDIQKATIPDVSAPSEGGGPTRIHQRRRSRSRSR